MTYPLTSQQARVWASCLLRASAAQHCYLAAVPPEISRARLADAVRMLGDRHLALRTRIWREAGQLYQCADGQAVSLESRVAPNRAMSDTLTDLCGPSPLLVDVSAGRPTRFVLVEGPAGDRCLVVAVHATVADGWSRVRLLTELDRILADGGPGSLPPASGSSLGELAERQRQWYSSAEFRRRLEFWQARLSPVEPSPVPAPAAAEESGGHQSSRILNDATVRALRERCAAAKVGPSAAYAAGLAAAAAGDSGPPEVQLCLLTSGRTADVGTQLGVFANHLITPIEVTAARKFDLSAIWAEVVTSLRNEIPLAGLLEHLPGLRGKMNALMSRGIGFQVAPSWPRFDVLQFDNYEIPQNQPRPVAAIEVSVRPGPGNEIVISAVHDRARCAQGTADDLLDGMLRRLASMTTS